jgi:hypothetical protein
MEPQRTVDAGLRERQLAFAPSFLDWGAIVAGAVIAAAVMALFVKFGLALGLGIAPPVSGTERWGMPAWGYVVAMGLWLILTQIAALFSGGYVAGRMRRPAGEAADSEAHVRDGMNGLTVWAVASVLMVALTVWMAASGISTATSAIGTAAQTAASSPASGYVADLLLRPGDAGGAATDAQAGANAPAAGGTEDADAVRRIVERAADFTIDEADKTFIAQVIARRTGLSDQEARQRIDQVMGRFAQEAEEARRYGIVAAFVSAVTALITAAAAWSAAVLGGAHRDGRSARELRASRAW